MFRKDAGHTIVECLAVKRIGGGQEFNLEKKDCQLIGIVLCVISKSRSDSERALVTVSMKFIISQAFSRASDVFILICA